MTKTAPRRIDRLRWLPISTLVAALATVFVVAGDRSQFYRSANHDYGTAKVLAITENLSAEHGFRLFKRIYPGPDGAVRYEMYSRFPVASYLLVKTAIAPAGDDLQAKIFMARMLMLTLFCAAAILLWDSLARLAKGRWIALVATLLACSSQYLLYFADAVDTETSVDLFGMMLAFHGIVVFVLHGRLVQLLAKTGAALLLGWHVVGLLLVFVVLGLVREIAAMKRGRGSVVRGGWRALVGMLGRSRYLLVGLFTVLGVGVVAGVNFAVEYFALGGKVPFTEMPSLRSLLQKVGLAEAGDFYEPLRDQLAWPIFLASQMHRVGGVVLPSFLTAPLCSVDSMSAPHPVLVAVGGVATALCVVGLARLWRRTDMRHLVVPLGALAFSGFGWAVPLRNLTASFSHEQYAMFYVGVVPALVICAALAAPWRRLMSASSARVRIVAVAFAVVVFLCSSAQMAFVGKPTSIYQDEVLADFQAIRERTGGAGGGAKVFVVATGSPRRYLGARLGMEFFLSRRIWQYSDRREESYREIVLGEDGSVWQSPPWEGDGAPDFVVARDRFDIPALLTAANGTAFLYDSLPALADAYRGMPLLAAAPVARAKFDIHLKRRARGVREEDEGGVVPAAPWRSARAKHELAYFKEPCVEDDFHERFFLHVLPVAAEDLPRGARGAGFEGLDFDFLQHGVRLAGMCVATLRLPDYAIDRVRTGQFAASTGARSWQVEFSLDVGIDPHGAP